MSRPSSSATYIGTSKPVSFHELIVTFSLFSLTLALGMLRAFLRLPFSSARVVASLCRTDILQHRILTSSS